VAFLKIRIYSKISISDKKDNKYRYLYIQKEMSINFISHFHVSGEIFNISIYLQTNMYMSISDQRNTSHTLN